jgi:hypothetical protein
VVEHLLAKEGVAGSIPVSRSFYFQGSRYLSRINDLCTGFLYGNFRNLVIFNILCHKSSKMLDLWYFFCY